ncbi:auxin response factor 4-like [Benincasa hispida]|uniref:auxin response factor 4-like n=1 Tax=Benincasa hispida TaxID=102211 RepID=UPI0018FF61DE|nr:auxin response factor 4-like [Benincasa hispida]
MGLMEMGVECCLLDLHLICLMGLMLTTGWSIFVSQKNLIFGDAVLFLRSENGELRLGIRRAVRPRNGHPDSIVGNQNSCANNLTRVVKDPLRAHLMCFIIQG